MCHPQHFRRRSPTVCFYQLDPRGGVGEWCLRQAFKSNFGLLWPWPLTSWPPGLTVACRCPGIDETFANLHWNRFIRLQNRSTTFTLVTDAREQTDGRTRRERCASGTRILIKIVCSVSVTRSCVFIMLIAKFFVQLLREGKRRGGMAGQRVTEERGEGLGRVWRCNKWERTK